MANKYIIPVYEKIFDEKFCFSDVNHRRKMQNAVFLLIKMGVPVGAYKFRWYLNGPYSQDLHDDMQYESKRPVKEIRFLLEHEKRIENLRDAIHSDAGDSYTIGNWIDSMASICYLRQYILPFNATMDEVVDELERRKPHLIQHKLNVQAFLKAEEL